MTDVGRSTDTGATAIPRASRELLDRVEANVPHELLAERRWVAWDRMPRADGRPCKKPIDPRTGIEAKTTDPQTWGTFAEACHAALSLDRAGGIGFVLTDGPWIGIDLDHVIDRGTGDLAPSARELIDSLQPTFAEMSPGGDGLHLLLRGRKPSGWRSQVPGAFGRGTKLECYGGGTGRYFTMTGNVWSDAPVADASESDLAALAAFMVPKGKRKSLAAASAPPRPEPDEDDVARASWLLLDVGVLDDIVDDYDGWIRVLAALRPLGSVGLELAVAWSKRGAKFVEGDVERRWSGLKGSSVASLFGMADDRDPNWRARWQVAQRGAAVPTRALKSSDQQAEEGGGGEEPDLVPLGKRDPATGRLVLSPTRTLPTATAFLDEFYIRDRTLTLLHFASAFWTWRDNRYVLLEDAALRNVLHPWLHRALRYVYDKRADQMVLVDFESNPRTVTSALQTIQAEAFLPAATPVPGWLGERLPEFEPNELLPCRSMTLHLPSGSLLKPNPRLFNFNALDFDYDARAAEPVRWHAFLLDLFGDDTESITLLQDWFGYCLTADTSQQKMLLLVGPRRSGKGTIARVLSKLVGVGNVVGPTVGSLAGNFGLQPLLGKALAIVSDARFAGENVATVVERLLCISGEDAISVDRKFLESVTMKLPVRFVFLTNELPRFNDSSNALAGRFLVLRLTQSFYGKEDTGLTQALLAERPGILRWAISGWHRLRARGRFFEPESSRAAIQDIEDLSSPVGAFVREHCLVGPGHRVACADLYRAWERWCAVGGRSTCTNAQTFGRDLTAAFPEITRRRGTNNVSFYGGIGIGRGDEGG